MSDRHTAHEPHPTSAMDRQWERVVQRRELEAMIDEYYAMEDRVSELTAERDRLRDALRDLIEESAPLLPNGSYELQQATAALQEDSDDQ